MLILNFLLLSIPGDELSCAIQVANNFPEINPTLPILWISVQVFGYIQVHKYWKLSSIDVFSDADILGSYVLKQPIFQEKSKKQRIHFFATDEQVVACDLKLKDYQTCSILLSKYMTLNML